MRPFDDALRGFGHPSPAAEKIEWLEDDLRTLGTAVDPSSTQTLSAGSLAACVGILYVIEGASLGGRVIIRHVAPALGLSAEQGCRYFAGYGEQTGDRWKRTMGTMARFEAESTDPDSVSLAVDAAQRTFDVFLAAAELIAAGLEAAPSGDAASA